MREGLSAHKAMFGKYPTAVARLNVVSNLGGVCAWALHMVRLTMSAALRLT